MQRNPRRTKAPQALPGRRFPRRLIRADTASAGFFTIGFAIAVLAVGALFTGAVGELDVTQTASAPTPAETVGEHARPAADVNTEDANRVVVSEATADSPKRALGEAATVQ